MDVTELFTVIKKHKIERKMETLPTLLLDSLVHALLSRSDTVYRLLEELDENADGVLSMKELGDAFSRLVRKRIHGGHSGVCARCTEAQRRAATYSVERRRLVRVTLVSKPSDSCRVCH